MHCPLHCTFHWRVPWQSAGLHLMPWSACIETSMTLLCLSHPLNMRMQQSDTEVSHSKALWSGQSRLRLQSSCTRQQVSLAGCAHPVDWLSSYRLSDMRGKHCRNGVIAACRFARGWLARQLLSRQHHAATCIQSYVRMRVQFCK